MTRRIWHVVALMLIWILLGATAGPSVAQETPTISPPETALTPGPTPTNDRLAAPPTVASPTQADDGAQLYWLWCQPCHGDQGQGLTEEWRAQYPEEDRNCWGSGCHGTRPYEDGFTLPQHVPAVIGEQSLARFQTMDELFEYVHVKMPYEYPGALSEEEALAVTAYLARAHGKWDGTPLTLDSVGQYRWQPLPTATPQPADTASQQGAEGLLSGQTAVWLGGLLLLGMGLLGGAYLWRQYR